LSPFSFSKSGKLFAYGLSSSGSDWVSIHVKDTETHKAVEQKAVEWAKFTGINWTHDELGYFYTRYPNPETLAKDDAGTETDSNMDATVAY
jgi:prolyl oligopeptidase